MSPARSRGAKSVMPLIADIEPTKSRSFATRPEGGMKWVLHRPVLGTSSELPW